MKVQTIDFNGLKTTGKRHSLCVHLLVIGRVFVQLVAQARVQIVLSVPPSFRPPKTVTYYRSIRGSAY